LPSPGALVPLAQALNAGPDQFYAERDHRTQLGLPQPQDPVELAVGLAPLWAATPNGQLAMFWATSLIARMAGGLIV